jgi:hypothetical protein
VAGDRLGELARGGTARRHECDVDVPEVVVVLKQPHGELPPPERIGASRAPGRAEKRQFIDGEHARFEQFQEFLSHGAAGAHDRNFHVNTG